VPVPHHPDAVTATMSCGGADVCSWAVHRVGCVVVLRSGLSCASRGLVPVPCVVRARDGHGASCDPPHACMRVGVPMWLASGGSTQESCQMTDALLWLDRITWKCHCSAF
jgi:hypothetical protein